MRSERGLDPVTNQDLNGRWNSFNKNGDGLITRDEMIAKFTQISDSLTSKLGLFEVDPTILAGDDYDGFRFMDLQHSTPEKCATHVFK
jgi:hypothetical protein